MNTEQEQEQEQGLSYEEEQLQQILLLESERNKIQIDRELREAQEREYNEGLRKDMESVSKMNGSKLEGAQKEEVVQDEPDAEEMRRVRLIRFDGYQLIKG
jgi:hypothetical protein